MRGPEEPRELRSADIRALKDAFIKIEEPDGHTRHPGSSKRITLDVRRKARRKVSRASRKRNR